MEEKVLNNIEEQISKVGENTIMGDLAKMSNEETNNSVANLQEAQEASAETAQNVDSSVVSGKIDPSMFMRRKQKPHIKDYKVGRNDPCPCGSGEKYKKCCLASGRYETYHEV